MDDARRVAPAAAAPAPDPAAVPDAAAVVAPPAVVGAPRRSGGAMMIAAGILLSRLFGLVRERAFAHYLGNSVAAGAFRAAQRIPNLLQNLFGDGVLSASFIPVYARLLAEGRREEAGRVAGVVASLLTLTVAVLVALGVWATPWLIVVIAPGYTGETRALTIRLVEVIFPGIGLLVLSAWCLGVLNSHRRFFLSYVAPVMMNVAVIAALLAFGGARMGSERGGHELALIVSWATVAGAGLQLLVQAPLALSLARSGLRPSLSLASASARAVVSGFLPVVVSRGVVQLSAYVDTVLASYLGPAAQSQMTYAQILYMLPISLFGMSVSAAELPAMSGELGAADEVAAKLRSRIGGGLGRIAFFVVPSAVAFVALGDRVVGTLLQTGRFQHSDTVAVWTVLAGSTVGLLAATQANLFKSGFYALRDTRTPLRYAVIRVALTAAAGWASAFPLRRALGWSPELAAAAVMASAGLSGWLEFFLLRRALARRIGRVGVAPATMARLWGAAAAAAALAFGLGRAAGAVRHPLVTGAVVLALYGALYLGATAALGVGEARGVMARARRLLGPGRRV